MDKNLTQAFDTIEPFGALFTNLEFQTRGAKPPYWFALEGEDGTGKSHLANALKYELTREGGLCVVEAFGKHIRFEEMNELVNRSVVYANEFVRRHDQLAELYDRGFTIIQDRSFLSTVVYQEDLSVLKQMDTLYWATELHPTHIFILPKEDGTYGRYGEFQDCTALLMPLTRKEIYLIFVPAELSTLRQRIDFVKSVLQRGILLTGNLSQEETVQTDGGNTDGNTGNLQDGTGSSHSERVGGGNTQP